MPDKGLLNKQINIAIDGVSGCGKSSTAKEVARILDLSYLDTGAMYRAVTYYFLKNKTDINSETDVLESLKHINIDSKLHRPSGKFETFLNNVNIENEIRGNQVNNFVSEVSTLPPVRDFLVSLQRKKAQHGGIIMDGRDIGTVVMTNAHLKIFMTATPEVRAARRMKELQEDGRKVNYQSILDNLLRRDKMDSEREVSPLQKAKDAIELDTSNLEFSEQVGKIVDLALERAT